MALTAQRTPIFSLGWRPMICTLMPRSRKTFSVARNASSESRSRVVLDQGGAPALGSQDCAVAIVAIQSGLPLPPIRRHDRKLEPRIGFNEAKGLLLIVGTLHGAPAFDGQGRSHKESAPEVRHLPPGPAALQRCRFQQRGPLIRYESPNRATSYDASADLGRPTVQNCASANARANPSQRRRRGLIEFISCSNCAICPRYRPGKP